MLKNKGFTLIELMVVIVIIGILATLAIPKFNEASIKAKVSEGPTVLSTYDNAQLAYLAETSSLGVVSDLIMADPTPSTFSKYFTYSENGYAAAASVRFAGTTRMTVTGGATASIFTALSVNQTVSHGKTGTLDKILPNWN